MQPRGAQSGALGGTLSEERDPEAWSSLGSLEVLSECLVGSGTGLVAAAATATGAGEPRWGQQASEVTIPETGWREVARTARRTVDLEPPRTYPALISLAAPNGDDKAKWVVVQLTEPTDDAVDRRWLATTNQQVVRLRPGIGTRRQGVRLALPREPLVIIAGSVPDIVVTLQNTEIEKWHADPDDHGWVVAKLTDEDGGPPGQFGWFGLGWAPGLPDLPPRGSVNLAAWISRSTVRDAVPGRYGLVASLLTLGQSSNVRPVEIVADPRPDRPSERPEGDES